MCVCVCACVCVCVCVCVRERERERRERERERERRQREREREIERERERAGENVPSASPPGTHSQKSSVWQLSIVNMLGHRLSRICVRQRANLAHRRQHVVAFLK